MSLKNPYGLTLSLGGNDQDDYSAQDHTYNHNHNPYDPYSSSHMDINFGLHSSSSADPNPNSSSSYDSSFNTEALRQFSGNYSALFEMPESQLPELSQLPSSLSKPRSRIRDSAVLRSQQGFSVPEPPAPQPQPHDDESQYNYNSHNTFIHAEPEEPQLGQGPTENNNNAMPMLKLNHFVHNGYKYDGDIFELRPPQERSSNSRPERILQHKPAVLNHRQIFNRVYSEGTYNNRPSSLRQARLSIQSWNSLNLDMPLSPLSPPSTAAPHTPPLEDLYVRNTSSSSSSKRVSLLVENALVTKEQAMRIKVASPGAPPAQRAPRLVNHIIPQISLDEHLRAAAAAETQDKSFNNHIHHRLPEKSKHSKAPPPKSGANAASTPTTTSATTKKSKRSRKKSKDSHIGSVIPPNKENQVPVKSRSGDHTKTSIESAERIRAVPNISASKSKSGGSLGNLGKRGATKKKERRTGTTTTNNISTSGGASTSAPYASPSPAPAPKPIIDSNGAPVRVGVPISVSYIDGSGSSSRGILSMNNQSASGSADGKIRPNNAKSGKGSRKKKAADADGTKKTRKGGFWKNLGKKQ